MKSKYENTVDRLIAVEKEHGTDFYYINTPHIAFKNIKDVRLATAEEIQKYLGEPK